LTGEEDTATFAHTIERLNMVADLMGEDVPRVARAAGQAIKTDLAGNAEEAFDILTASQRNSLNVSEDLLDSFNEYSTQLRALGLEGEEGWALVAQGVKAGARDTDVVIDALKEFKLRVTDGTAAAADGFDKLGVNADDAQAAMAAGGEAGRDMMAQLLRGLQEIEDPQDRYNAALALFGTKFEDIQDAAYALNLDTAVKEFGQVEGSAAKAAETMKSNTAASFDEARRSIEVSMDAVNLALAEAFGPELTKISDWVATHKPEIMAFFFDLADGALLAGEGIARFVSGALHVIGPFSAITADAFGGALQTMGMFVDAAATVADALGMDGMAESLRSASGFLDEYGTKARENS
ncbi:phage tail tape measure protein, partial [Rhodococcus sp. CX]|uniref:phage tail tape measure protein n=1 Tax=Rhodococcus sp. CX TaxID=2789880 RepID=UPI0018CD6BC4